MAEYIEREAVPSCNECIHNGVCGLQEHCFDIELQLKEFGCDDFKPTADVVEVRHGEWVLEHETYGQMMCSVCGKECPTERKPDPYEECRMTNFYIKSNYCPNCGAKMDGKGDNDG